MTADHFDEEELLAFQDGQLDPAATERVKRRIAADPAVARRARELEIVNELLGSIPAAPGGREFAARVLARHRARRAWWRRPVSRVAAAILVAATLVGIRVFGGRDSATPAAPGPSEPVATSSDVDQMIEHAARTMAAEPAKFSDVASVLADIDHIQSDYLGSQ